MEAEEPTVRKVEARRGFFPVVTGDEVSLVQAGATFCLSRGDLGMTQAGARLSMAGGNLSIREGGSLLTLAGGDASIEEGGSLLLLAGRDVSISEGGAAVVAARQVRAERSFLGFVLGGKIDVADDSTLLIGSGQAAIFGAVAGLVCAIAGRLFAGRRRP